jgi:hypothetical protein
MTTLQLIRALIAAFKNCLAADANDQATIESLKVQNADLLRQLDELHQGDTDLAAAKAEIEAALAQATTASSAPVETPPATDDAGTKGSLPTGDQGEETKGSDDSSGAGAPPAA